MESLLKICSIVVLAFVAITAISLLISFPLMWSWNYVMPYLFGFKAINWGQAWCLSFISSTFFKSYNMASK
jgi:hypothetical protein